MPRVAVPKTRNRIPVIILAVVVVVLVAAGAIGFWQLQQQAAKEAEARYQRVVKQAQKDVSGAEYTSAEALLTPYLSGSVSDAHRIAPTLLLAEAYYDEGKFDLADENFKKADSLHGLTTVNKYLIASRLAAIADSKGNKSEAAKYYKQIIENLKANKSSSDYGMLPDFEKRLKELGE